MYTLEQIIRCSYVLLTQDEPTSATMILGMIYDLCELYQESRYEARWSLCQLGGL